MNKKFNQELFDRMPVVGIMRNFPEQHVEEVVTEFHKCGFTTLEITMNSGNAAEMIKKLRAEWGEHLNIGAGTVCSMKELEAALEAGAQFIVAPITNKKVIKASVSEGIPVFPGAFTPTEIYSAWKWGADMIKVFPATSLGPSYIRDVLEPLNKIPLLPTGGVNKDNFLDYLKAGAKGVGMAGGLFPREMIAAEKWSQLSALYCDIVGQYHQYRSELPQEAGIPELSSESPVMPEHRKVTEQINTLHEVHQLNK